MMDMRCVPFPSSSLHFIKRAAIPNIFQRVGEDASEGVLGVGPPIYYYNFTPFYTSILLQAKLFIINNI